jgi:P27 family predicted phage terminase small subunit
MNVKQIIVDFLKAKDNFQESDLLLVDELVFNFRVIKEAKEDIKERGIILNKARNNSEGGFQRGDDKKNKSYEIYVQSMKEVKDLFVKLGITPQERVKLKIEISDKIDQFDKVFNN